MNRARTAVVFTATFHHMSGPQPDFDKRRHRRCVNWPRIQDCPSNSHTLRQLILEDMLTLLNAAGRTADAAPYQEQWAALQ